MIENPYQRVTILSTLLSFTAEDFIWDISGPIYDFSVPSIVIETSAMLYTAAVCSGEPSLSLPFTGTLLLQAR